jgi:arabinogalactan endo-1,4-beta-galactosidase
MIQIGNETNGGMLWPTGKTDAGFTSFATLLKAGIKAVRDFSKTSTIQPKIILHVAQFQNATYWAQQLINSGVTDYDVVGVSHYYKWSTVTTMAGVTSAIAALKAQTGKQVMVVETSFPFTNDNADSYANTFYEASASAVGYPFTIEGQKNYFTDLTKAIINGGGSGIMVWEPAWITSKLNDGWGVGSSWDNTCFFDFQGNLHAGISFMTVDYGL